MKGYNGYALSRSTEIGRLSQKDRTWFDESAANGRNRRIFLLTAHPGEGRFLNGQRPAQAWQPELVFMPLSGHCWEARATARSVGFDTFVLFGDQAPVSLATTVKLGRASAGLVLRTTLNAATGRRRPFSSRFPRSSSLATPSTASAIRLLIRIWPSFASAQSRAARLQTVPIAV